MDVGLWDAITIFLLIFALGVLIAGAFTAYFGSGKSRKIGAGLIGLGLVIGIVWIYLAGLENMFGDFGMLGLIIETAKVLIAALLGALAAVGLFLLAIMKS